MARAVVPQSERRIIHPPPPALKIKTRMVIIIKTHTQQKIYWSCVCAITRPKPFPPALFIFISAFKISHLNF